MLNKIINTSSVLIVIFLSPLISRAIIIDGHCFLQNMTNHDGTKVFFEADSPGGETDSVYTDASGYYQIDVLAAFYNVYYTHEEFYGDEILGLNCYSPVTLPDITLQPVEQVLSGALSGVLEAGEYTVEGDIFVDQGDSLFIMPNAVLMFDGSCGFTIDGYLEAVGTENDSIKFQPQEVWISWEGITFSDNSADESLLAYCVIYGAENGVTADNSSPSIGNCRISENNFYGLSLTASESVIDNCGISDNGDFGIYINGSAPTVSNCVLTENSGGVLCLGSSAEIIGNNIYGNTDSGISITAVSQCTVTGNTIHDNVAAFGGGIYCNNSIPVISDNEIIENTAFTSDPPCGGGIYLSQCGEGTILQNNLISGNEMLGGSGAYRYYYGAGIYCTNSSPLISGNTITDNFIDCAGQQNHHHMFGGGLFITNSSPAISENTIQGNYLFGYGIDLDAFWGYGAGICIQSSSGSIAGNNIIANYMEGTPGWIGASDFYFYGGGIYLSASEFSITGNNVGGNSLIFDSDPDGFGAGIYCASTLNGLTISNNSIYGNSSSGGGGIYSDGSSPIIKRNVLVENHAASGGGIFYTGGAPQILNCTLSGNSNEGIRAGSASSIISNNILSHTGDGPGINFTSTPAVVNYCDFYANEYGNFTGSSPAYIGINSLINANSDSCDIYHNLLYDPQFINPQEHLLDLLEDSPCIDAGDPTFPFDPDGTISDIGAFYFDQSLPEVDDLTITVVLNDVILYWSPFTAAQSYNIYRSEVPYFDISGMTPLAQVTDPQYVDLNAFPGGPWFYVVTYEY